MRGKRPAPRQGAIQSQPPRIQRRRLSAQMSAQMSIGRLQTRVNRLAELIAAPPKSTPSPWDHYVLTTRVQPEAPQAGNPTVDRQTPRMLRPRCTLWNALNWMILGDQSRKTTSADFALACGDVVARVSRGTEAPRHPGTPRIATSEGTDDRAWTPARAWGFSCQRWL